jgi:cell division protein FtsB
MMRALLKASKFLGYRIVLPDVAYDELIGKASEAIEVRVLTARKANRNLAAVTGHEFGPLDSNEEFSNYEDWLSEEIKNYEVEILPYPATTAKELVQKAYDGEKPFKANGSGHKDYLIWKSILECLAKGVIAPAYFLTANKRDFCDENKDPVVLHADLAKQLAENQTLEVFLDLGKFFNQKIAPELQGVDAKQIPDDMNEKVVEIVEERLTDYSAFGFEGVPIQNEALIVCVENIRIDEPQIRGLNDDEILISFECVAEAYIHGFMDKHECYSEGHDIDIWDPDWNDYVMGVSTTSDVPVTVNFIYSKADHAITGYDVDLPTEISSYEF